VWAWNRPLAIAGEIPQLPDRGRRHEAAPQQPMLQQLRQPGRVADIGLAAGEDLDLPGVDQQQLEAPLLKDPPDGLPVLAGGLHHHLGDPLGGQPPSQRLQPRGEGLERPHLLVAATVPAGHAHASHHLVLATSNPAQRGTSSSTVDTSPSRGWRPAGPTDQATLKRVLTATVRGAGKAPASVLSTGSRAPRKPSLAGHTQSSSLVAAPGHGGPIRDRQSSAVLHRIRAGRALRKCHKDGVNRGPQHLPRELNATSIGCGDGSISKVTPCWVSPWRLVELMVQAHRQPSWSTSGGAPPAQLIPKGGNVGIRRRCHGAVGHPKQRRDRQ
jgi:hypothetical protein